MDFKSYIALKDIRIYAHHGVMQQERVVGADFIISVSIGYDFSDAMKTDDLKDTLNYTSVYEIIKREMGIPSNLLEHVAGRIGSALKNTYPNIFSLHLNISKAAPPMGVDCERVGVELYIKY